jgi:hypothetical protein
MRDPWEPDIPAQPDQTDLDQMTTKSETLVKLADSQQMPEKAVFPKQQTSRQITPAPHEQKYPQEALGLLQFNRTNYIRGIIWAEILGKPKAKRSRNQL